MVLAQLAALKTTSTADLKAQWRKLNDTEPPAYNRRFLESRLAYRIQELAYGGLKPGIAKKLEALGEQIDGRRSGKRRPRMDAKPIAGTRLVREWQGTVQTVTVTADGFEWQGQAGGEGGGGRRLERGSGAASFAGSRPALGRAVPG